MKFKEIGLILWLILFTVINVRSNNLAIHSNNNNNSSSLEELTEYLVDVEKGGDKTVVLLVSGTAYADKKPIHFVDAKPLEVAKRELKRAGYSIITLTTPCAVRCYGEYTDLGLLIVELNPSAVIYKGIHSDLGTDNLNKILTLADIPIYTYGTEIVLDYVLYTGPDNEGLAKAVANGLKDKVQKGETVIYIDTNDRLTNNILDNGYIRMKAVKKELKAIGLKEVDSVATSWNRAFTFEEISRVLKNHGKVDYIIAPSIETGLGAAEAVERLGYKNEIKIIAMDFTEEGVRLLQEGRLYGLVGQGLTDQGFALVEAIERNERTYRDQILFSTDTIITLENLDDYRLSSGTYKW